MNQLDSELRELKTHGIVISRMKPGLQAIGWKDRKKTGVSLVQKHTNK